MKISRAIATAAVIAAATGPLLAHADVALPKDAKSISEVVTTLQEKGYESIVEVTYDDKKWEAEAYKDGERYEIDIDPMSGEIIKAERDS